MIELKSALKTTSKYINILQENWIKNIRDLLLYFPRTYEDRSNIKTLDEIDQNSFFFKDKKNQAIMTKWQITKKSVFSRWWKRIYDIHFVDERWNKGYISIFNSNFLAKKIEENNRYIIIWKPSFRFGKIIFSHPEVILTQEDTEEKSDYNTGRLYPIYPELWWIKSSRFASKIRWIIDTVDTIFEEYLPSEFLEKYNLPNITETIKNIHYPQNVWSNNQALYRIFFDRLLRVQLHSLINRQSYQNSKINPYETMEPEREMIKDIIEKLPFELTNAQKKVTKHIIDDIHQEKPMLRLLQWDVGSGKTIVAAISAYYTHKKFKWQSAFLAPLEVLANQHYKTLSKLLLPLWLRTELLVWSISKDQKEKIKSDLKLWKIHVLIWTHAILQEDVEFRNLEFAVIDEQHKFWVKQRAFFKKFGAPNILQMSATPIPRSMALAFFWEFDVSIIDELPLWRLPIHTKIISQKEYYDSKFRLRVMDKINKWEKVFIVTPLIEESEKMEDLKAATTEFEDVKKIFKEIKDKIWIMHGKLKAKEKEQVMNDFKSWKLSILVSTTVIEVWVDVPEATIMIIKNSERFWLSQLHQLRWRIWRSNIKSYCFLETKNKSWDTYKRLKSMEETNDWFKLAEIDLQQRWPWEILWTIQSGETDIPLEILSDLKFLEKVQEWAIRLLEKYPNLEGLTWLKQYLNEKMWDVLA